MIIVGAKGFAKQLVEIFFQSNRKNDLYFFDDVSKDIGKTMFGINIIRNMEQALVVFQTISNEFCLGVGDPISRRALCVKFEAIGGDLCSVISPYAHIASFVRSIGKGTNILTGAILENDVTIGNGVLININAVIHHDVVVGDFCEVSPGAKVLGNVNMGHDCIIGANAVILPNVRIGDNAVIGAGAVVTKDIRSNKIMVGIPAKEIGKKE